MVSRTRAGQSGGAARGSSAAPPPPDGHGGCAWAWAAVLHGEGGPLRAGTHCPLPHQPTSPLRNYKKTCQRWMVSGDTVGKVEFIEGVRETLGWDSGEPAACVTRPLPR
ncbi:hypothetical protein GWK47_054229 [Chionoecetes opilio]|uniref:Uncharacterized protein n=1 Tax=Chionoecetes opilio TaxID=41210 RepID=A0A8J4Y770_CHIOP|nr:hypothetical protein GWK47_054229 [Chionoecetes opilio]